MTDDNRSPTKLIIALAVAAAVVAGVAGFWFGRPQVFELQSGSTYPNPKTIEPFELVSKDGQPFTLDDWRGRWDLVFFGFTYCPDICPNALNMMRGIRRELANDVDDNDLPRVTLISVDPNRDTPARLKEYVEYFDPSYLAATGTAEQIQAVAKQLNIAYVVAEHEPGDLDYDVDHFAGILLIDPDAAVRGIFTMPHDADAITADLRRLLD